jgi:molybdopterin-guanine dinucleotide biosynthesis protein A
MNVPSATRGRAYSVRAVIGALLAGGSGRRLGAPSKPAVALAGRPLAAYPAEALRAVCERVAVVCKADTQLPELDGVERWDEPDEPRHPLTGIVHALASAGSPVLVCAADMPFVTADACRTLLAAAGAAPAVVAVADGVLQPTLGLYAPAALEPLRAAPADAPLTRTVEALRPARVALPGALVASVNTPEELAAAEARLGQRHSGEIGTEIT